MTTYPCIICGRPVDEDLDVAVFLNPPNSSFDAGEGTPYVLNIAPCCGRRQCVEKAFEEVKRSTIGHIEISRAQMEEEEEREEEEEA